ncbi:universal stress protein [Croceitalea rosinachiae]|uniref:Universal stress protein n=1 Tax=Croceitalea rosinachiae TaxID=3075596 RepID=A0ABU3A944_9FLAO|nr:universal stress protein [Croceitalea sp. F388]MDT0606405.1 universal stress protein [Croceitalea sp. F388]
MNNILVPLGTAPDSHETLKYAIDFAADFGASVFIMDVFVVSTGAGSLGNVTEKVTSTSREKIKELVSNIDTKGVDVKIASYNGDIIDGLKEITKELEIDLIIIAPRSNDINEELYLGNTSGRIIKQTDIPTLIVPKATSYKPIESILTAFKSGILKRSKILYPLVSIMRKNKATVNLLLVKTPGYKEEDLQINTALLDVSRNLIISENPTTYLGVLEHLHDKNPDMLCVFRRKRGFFKKLWEKSTVPKAEFYATVPVLVLSAKKD